MNPAWLIGILISWFIVIPMQLGGISSPNKSTKELGALFGITCCCCMQSAEKNNARCRNNNLWYQPRAEHFTTSKCQNIEMLREHLFFAEFFRESKHVQLMVQKSGEPVEVGSLSTVFAGFYTSQVVQVFFRQQYVAYITFNSKTRHLVTSSVA